MNRFLYAEANPTTLVDPSGHCIQFAIAGPPGAVAASACFVVVVSAEFVMGVVAVGTGAGIGYTAHVLAQPGAFEPYDFNYWDTVSGPRPMGPPSLQPQTPPIPTTMKPLDPNVPQPEWRPFPENPGPRDVLHKWPGWPDPVHPELQLKPAGGGPKCGTECLKWIAITTGVGLIAEALNGRDHEGNPPEHPEAPETPSNPALRRAPTPS